MASNNGRRTQWHLSHGKWTRSLGERGMRIRLFQKRKDGPFYGQIWVAGCGRKRISLGTHDRGAAEQFGKRLIADQLIGEHANANGPVQLSELWEQYRTTCPSYLDNTLHVRRDAVTKMKYVLGYFGSQYDVRQLTPSDVLHYTQQRRTGGILRTDGKRSKPVGQRTVCGDLALLRVMFRWACTVRTQGTHRWLDRNPLEGIRFEYEKNPRRPVVDRARMLKTRQTIQTLATNAKSENLRRRWTLLDMAVMIAYATGRRRGSIAALHWEDVDFVARTVTWQPTFDKKRMEWVVPMPQPFFDELRRFQKVLGVISGPMFPSVQDPTRAICPDLLSSWLEKAEQAGNIPKLRGGLWHPYRRGWATARIDQPLKVVAQAGGWLDVATMVKAYQHPTDAMLLAVMQDPTVNVVQSNSQSTEHAQQGVAG